MANKVKIMEEYDKMHSLYERFSEDIHLLLKKILNDANISFNAVTYRVKGRDNLSEKIDRKNDKYGSLSQLTDIAGVRVIAYYADDVDKIAELVEREFVVDKKNSIDKRKALEPDRFGYCSVHYVVEMDSKRLNLLEYKAYKDLKCEIQIRSVLQHAWAEIEHDLGYKTAIAIPREIRRDFSRLAGLLELADKEFKEIREKLVSYKEEMEEKIAKADFADAEIDAISLKSLLDNNADLIELNNKITELFESKYNPTNVDLLGLTINQLRYFDIKTLEQLLNMIAAHKKNAMEIAKAYAQRSKNKGKMDGFTQTVSIFYLCYAELIARTGDLKEMLQYFEQNHIGGDSDKALEAAKKLLEVRNQIYSVKEFK